MLTFDAPLWTVFAEYFEPPRLFFPARWLRRASGAPAFKAGDDIVAVATERCFVSLTLISVVVLINKGAKFLRSLDNVFSLL